MLYYNTQLCHVSLSRLNISCQFGGVIYVYQIYFRVLNLLDV